MEASMNASVIEDDPFLNARPELDYDEIETFPIALDYLTIITEILKTIICLCVIGADIFLITIICKFKKLRSRTNSYIMHYAIFNMFSFVAAPVGFIVLEITGYLSSTLYCLLWDLDISCLSFSFLFAFGLCLDWILMNFQVALGQKFQAIYKYFIVVLYAIGLLQFVIRSSFCFKEDFTTGIILVKIGYFFILILNVYLNFADYRKKISVNNRKCYSLKMANIIIFSWLPLYTFHIMYDINVHREIIGMILYYTIFLPEYLAYGNPIIIVFVLGRLNKHFQMAYDSIFKRSTRNYTGDEENLDVSDEEKNSENANTS